MNKIQNILDIYFQEGQSIVPIFNPKNNEEKEKLACSTLQTLLQKYFQYIRIYHSSTTTVSLTDPTSLNFIGLNTNGRDITINPIVLFSQYLYYNALWFVHKHPRREEFLNTLNRSDISIHFRDSDYLKREYLHGDLSRFLENLIVVFNQYLVLQRLFSQRDIQYIQRFDPFPATVQYVLKNKHYLEPFLKRYGLIMR